LKILFVSSGNSGKAGLIVQLQAESLKKEGIAVDFFLIKGRGIYGYLKNISYLHHYLKTNRYDLIHAHYSFSAFVASLAGSKPLMVSLMGSDIKSGKLFFILIHLFRFFFRWKTVIVKSLEMKKKLKFNDVQILANGVDLNNFRPLDLVYCQRKLNWDTAKKHILFAANPNRPEKNYRLAKEAIMLLKDDNVELHALENVPHYEVPYYYNASDVVILPSKWEGSPNVVKEAMCCNCPVVTTLIGDVKYLFGVEGGYYISLSNPEDLSDKILLAINFRRKYSFTEGRKRIIVLKLDSENVAIRLINLYRQIVEN
jgi:glycosyltransferase involved in cell wall biosynthesis